MKAASLNHVYRLIWSKIQQAWVAVAEGTRASGKSSLSGQVSEPKESGSQHILGMSLASGTKRRFVIATAFAASLLPMSSFADTNVVAGVVAGDLTIKDISATHTQYTHTANVNIVDFYKFGVLKDHQLDVVMPDAGRALYRVIGNGASEILGKLNSNGSLFLINQNGILFGSGSEVNVGNIVASSMDISNDNFLKGNYQFAVGSIAGSVENHGVIKSHNEGYIVLLGKTVDNTGTLIANNGSVVLGSANEATLDFYGNGLVKVKLSGDALEATVRNSGLIQADGGLVQLAANARSAAINVSGIIEANQLVERDGVIRLEGGDNAKVQVSGKLLAKGEHTTGGTIEVTGEQVALLDGAVLDASGDKGGGKVLVGGDYQGKNDAVYNARTSYVAAGATIKADAIEEGDGGKVIVWADDLTRYYGQISAQGGATKGNGGFVEVSGKQNLGFQGKVNVAAANGLGGTVLLDPENIILNNSFHPALTDNPNGTPDVAFADNAGGTTFIQTTNVIGFSELFLQANNNITVDSPLVMLLGGNIRFEANNNINVNAKLETGINGSINLKADADNSGVGNLAIGADIIAPGGVTLSGATLTHTAGDISSSGNVLGFGHAGNVTITVAGLADLGNANINANGRPTLVDHGFNGGNVKITAGSVNMTGSINTSGSDASIFGSQGGQGGKVTVEATNNATIGNITTSAGSAGDFSGASRLSGEVKVTSTSGDVVVKDVTTKGGFNAIGSNVTLTANNGKVTAGNIDTSAGTGRIGTDGKSAGNVNITAGTGIATQTIIANGANGVDGIFSSNKSGGAAGAATLKTAAGDIELGAVNVQAGTKTGTGIAGNGAAILAEAGNNINVNGNVTNDKGTVTLKADADNNNAGNLAIKANITGPGGVTLSGATLSHTAGDISSAGNAAGFGHAGGVIIKVAGLADLGSANIVATGRTASGAENGFNGGNVEITAGGVNMTGNINTSGSNAGNTGNQGGQGGKVTVATTNNASIGNITTSAGGAASGSTVSRSSGEVNVTSASGDVVVKDVTTKGGFNAIGSNVTLTANNGKVTTGNIDTSAGAGRSGTDGKSAGNVMITAGTGITTQSIVANGANGVGANKSGGAAGAATLKTTAGDIELGAVNVQAGTKTGTGVAGNAADILAEAGNNINVNGNVTNDKGTVTLKADADNNNAGNLAIKANITGPGNVNLSGATLTHTAGDISSAGNTAGFGHAGNVTITVAGLADLGSANIVATGRTATGTENGFNGGNVKITAGSANMTGSINTSGSNAGATGNQGGQGGKVTVATANNASIGNITTSAGDAASGSTLSRTSGEVNVTSTSGDVVVKDVATKGGFNSTGANVILTAANGKVTTGNIDTSAGAGRNNTDGKSAGNVSITAGTGIATQTIIANGANGVDGVDTNKSGGAAGAVTLKTAAGNIDLGAVNVQAGTKTGTGVAGNAADILAEAGNNINVNGNVTNDKGIVTLKADADNSGAGNLAIGANITGPGSVNLSGATLTHTAGDISSAGNTAGFGHAGNVTITVAGLADLGSANIVATGRTATGTENGFNGGSVTITAGSANMTGSINTSGSAASAKGNQGGQGGKVTVATTNNANIGNITTSAGDAAVTSTVSRASGEVNVTSTSGDVVVKDVTTKGGFNSIGSNVILTAANGKVTTGNVDASAGAGRDNTDGKSAGNVNVTAGTGITTQTIIANGANGVGVNKSGGAAGSVTLKSTSGDINLGSIALQSGNKTGTGVVGNLGKILVQAGQDLPVPTVGNIKLNGDISNLRGDLTHTTNAADAVQLVATGKFDNTNNRNINTSGNWTIYSNNPVDSNMGTLTDPAKYDYVQYGSSFGDTLVYNTLNPGNPGNGFVYKVVPTVVANLSGTSTKVFDGNNIVTDLSGLSSTAIAATVNYNNVVLTDNVTISPLAGATFNDPSVGTGKPITSTFTIADLKTAEGKSIFIGAGSTMSVTTNSTATGTILPVATLAVGFASPRDNAGLGGLIPNNPALNTMTIVSLNPAAGDEEDLDAVACPVNEDSLGSTPVLNSGVKLPDGVSSNCI